jgi:hypothetical protein
MKHKVRADIATCGELATDVEAENLAYLSILAVGGQQLEALFTNFRMWVRGPYFLESDVDTLII